MLKADCNEQGHHQYAEADGPLAVVKCGYSRLRVVGTTSDNSYLPCLQSSVSA